MEEDEVMMWKRKIRLRVGQHDLEKEKLEKQRRRVRKKKVPDNKRAKTVDGEDGQLKSGVWESPFGVVVSRCLAPCRRVLALAATADCALATEVVSF